MIATCHNVQLINRKTVKEAIRDKYPTISYEDIDNIISIIRDNATIEVDVDITTTDIIDLLEDKLAPEAIDLFSEVMHGYSIRLKRKAFDPNGLIKVSEEAIRRVIESSNAKYKEELNESDDNKRDI